MSYRFAVLIQMFILVMSLCGGCKDDRGHSVSSEDLRPGLASNPFPCNSASGVSILCNLSWEPANNATSYNVYFGSTPSLEVSELKGNQGATNFDPGSLQENSVYYWRIDPKNTAGTTRGDVWSFSTTSCWENVSTSGPPGRSGHTMIYDSTRKVVVLFGGCTGVNEPLSDTWEWDGTEWTQVATNCPPARYDHAMAYDSYRNKVVLYGGWDAHYSVNMMSDTWEWDGSQWTEISTIGAQKRCNHVMAYDASRKVVVLFGGEASDTWEWDGTDWSEAVASGEPYLLETAITYNTTRETATIFGGVRPGGHEQNTTWEWNGSAWSQVLTNNNPPARYSHSICYDCFRNATIVFGGLDSISNSINDTWELRGESWYKISRLGPSSRCNHAMCYDSQRKVAVLFGGYDVYGDCYLNDTWELTVTE